MLLKRTLQYLPAQLIAPAAQLAALLFWAHLLPPAKVAVITMLVSIQDGAYILFFQWWSHYILRNGQASRIRMRNINESESVALKFCAGFLTIFVAVFSFLYLPHESFATPYIGIGFVLTRALATYRAEGARAAGRVRIYTVVQIGGSLGGLIVALIAVHYWPYADTVLMVFTGINLILFFIARSDVVLKTAGKFRWKVLLFRAINYGGAAAVATVCTFGVMNFQRFAAQGLWDFSTAGIFSVGYGIGSRIISVAAMMVSAAGFPLVIKRLHSEGKVGAIDQISQNSLLLLFLLLPSLVICYYLTPLMVKTMLPVSYQSIGMQILPLAALLATVRFMRSHSVDQIFLTFDKTMQLAWLGLIELLFAIGSVGVFHFFGFGVQALVLGPIIVCVITTLGSFFWAIKCQDMNPRWGDLFGLFFAACALTMAYELMGVHTSVYLAVVQAGLIFILYVAVALVACPTLKKRIWRKS